MLYVKYDGECWEVGDTLSMVTKAGRTVQDRKNNCDTVIYAGNYNAYECWGCHSLLAFLFFALLDVVGLFMRNAETGSARDASRKV